ncbi:hypothetical protein HDV05_000975 [Chytridiales sp. JEL 0842]|nr:hypothetical protein HDV05_000975 [Chytridiales sp. JEL 0842]
MTIKIYGALYSTCTQRVLTTLREKNVTDFEIVSVDLMKGQHKTPEHLVRQPFGKIPALEDTETGVVMFESRAMARYIAKKYKNQGSDLLADKKGAKEQAAVETWAYAESSNFDPFASKLAAELIFKKWRGLEADPAAVAENREALASTLDVYDQILGTRQYLAGNEFTLADLFHLPYGNLLFAGGQGDLIENRKNVASWWKRITERKTWQDTVPKQ